MTQLEGELLHRGGHLGERERLLQQLGHDAEPFRVPQRPEQLRGPGELVAIAGHEGADRLQGRAGPERRPLLDRVAGVEERLPDGGTSAAPGDDDVEGGDDQERDQRVHPPGSEADPEQTSQSQQAGADAGHHPDIHGRCDHDPRCSRQTHQACTGGGRGAPDGDVAADPHGDEDAALDGQPLDLGEEVLDRDPRRHAQGDVHRDPQHGGRDHSGEEGGALDSQSAGDQGRVDAQPRDQPGHRQAHPAGRPDPRRDPLQGALPMEPPGHGLQPSVPERPRPVVADQRAAGAGDHRHRGKDPRIEAAGTDQETGGEQGQLARREGKRDARLLGEEQPGQQGKGHGPMQALKEIHSGAPLRLARRHRREGQRTRPSGGRHRDGVHHRVPESNSWRAARSIRACW